MHLFKLKEAVGTRKSSCFIQSFVGSKELASLDHRPSKNLLSGPPIDLPLPTKSLMKKEADNHAPGLWRGLRLQASQRAHQADFTEQTPKTRSSSWGFAHLKGKQRFSYLCILKMYIYQCLLNCMF